MNHVRRVFASLLIVAVLSILSLGDARADTSTAIYDDLKDVIGKLVERRVANGAADFLERASPALRFYLRRTLDRVRHDQWSALKDALVDDLSDIVGDYAFWALIEPSGKASFARFVACFEPVAIGVARTAPDPACDMLRTRAAKKADTLYRDACEASEPEKRDGHDIACDVAAMMRATLLGHVDEGARRLAAVTVTSASFLSPSFERAATWDSPNLHGHHSTLARVLARYADGNLPSWLTANRSLPAVKELLGDCLGKVEPSTHQHVFPFGAREHLGAAGLSADEKQLAMLCLNAWAPLFTNEFTAEINGQPFLVAGKPRRFAAPPMPTAPAVFGVPEITQFFSSIYTTVGAPAPAVVTVRFGRMRWRSSNGTTWTEAPGSPALAEASQVVSAVATNQPVAQQLSDLLKNELGQQTSLGSFACQENCPFEVLRLGAQLRALSERTLHTKTSQNLEADVEAALRMLRGHIDDRLEIEEIYAKSHSTKTEAVLRVVSTMQSLDARATTLSGIPALVRTIVSGDRAEFATSVLKVALADVVEGPSDEVGPMYIDRLYGAFVVNFVNYLLADKTGTSQESVRDGFRVSAARLLDGLSSSDGYFRSGFSPYPVVSLRFSWNPGYFSATSGDGFRYIASVDWPTVRTRFGSYVAVQFSMLDFAAPLSEFALRKPVGYENQSLVVLDMVRPRLSMLFGVPQITRNVVATVGISARLLAVCGTVDTACDPPRDPPPHRSLTYRTTMSNTAANNQIPEVNLGVSYVF
jgi:hypothetical protein